MNFVVTTGPVEKHNAEVRKLIRTHVMLGKNRGRVLPPRKKKNVTAVTESSPIRTATIPRKFGSDLSAVQFAETVTPEAVDLVLQFSSIVKKILFPLEKCIHFDRRAEVWVAPLTTDPAYLHIVIFGAQYYFDTILPKQTGYSTVTYQPSHHLARTLKLLRERLANDDEKEKISYTTIAVIISLAGHAAMTGDMKSARNHVEGLYKIFALRGGMESFRGVAKLLIEMLRMDLGMALHEGSKALFFDREPFMPYPNLSLLLPLDSSCQHAIILKAIDLELVEIWKVLSKFCSVINVALQSKQVISTETYLETMASTIYRLLNMRFISNSQNEAIRLGVIAFTSGVFLQWRGMGVKYPHFTCIFRTCLEEVSNSRTPPQLMTWLLMVGAAGVFDTSDDVWLEPLLSSSLGMCGIGSWSEMRELLESFLWIDLVFERSGKRMYESIADRDCRLLEMSEP